MELAPNSLDFHLCCMVYGKKFTVKPLQRSKMLLTFQNHWESSHNKIFVGKAPGHIKYREAALTLTFHTFTSLSQNCNVIWTIPVLWI